MTRDDHHTNDPSQAAAFERIHGEEHEFAQPPWNNPPSDPRPLADGKAGQVVTCGEHDLTGTHGEARWYYLGWVLALLILALVFLAVFTPPVGSDHCTGGGKGSGATPVRCTP